MQRLLLIKGTNGFEGITYPLGLMYLSAAVKRAFPDVETRLVDLRLTHVNYQTLEETLHEFRPTAVGISLLSVELCSLPEIIQRVRAYSGKIPVLLGGPHASSNPKGALADYPEVDFAIAGEGEETIVEWLGAFNEGRTDWSEVKGVTWRGADGAVISNPPRPSIEDIESIAPPDYDVVNVRDYFDEWSMSATNPTRFHKYANLFTSRACPFKCTYCHDIFGKGFRAQSPEYMVAEIERLQKNYGIEQFEILDDIFNFDLDRVKAFCRLLLARGIKAGYSFPNALRTDRLDKEAIALFKQVGVFHISIAVETATPRLQKQIRKNLKLDIVEEMIAECHKHRIVTRGFFMIGFPSETREEILDTIEYARRSFLTIAYFFIVIPFEGTQLANDNREMIDSMDIDYGSINYWTTNYNMSAVSNDELKKLQKMALRKFYVSLRRMRIVYDTYGSPWKFAKLWIKAIPSMVMRYFSQDNQNFRKRFWNLLKARTEKQRALNRQAALTSQAG